jgi:hypothetical protein
MTGTPAPEGTVPNPFSPSRSARSGASAGQRSESPVWAACQSAMACQPPSPNRRQTDAWARQRSAEQRANSAQKASSWGAIRRSWMAASSALASTRALPGSAGAGRSDREEPGSFMLPGAARMADDQDFAAARRRARGRGAGWASAGSGSAAGGAAGVAAAVESALRRPSLSRTRRSICGSDDRWA